MKPDNISNIRSLDDLNRKKQELRDEIAQQEQSLLEHPLVSIPMALFETSSVKGSLHNSIESFSLSNYKGALMGLLSTLMLANKTTRKFYIGFVIAKELLPYTFKKVEELLKK